MHSFFINNRIPNFQFGLVEKKSTYDQFSQPAPWFIDQITGTQSTTVEDKLNLSATASEVSIKTKSFYLGKSDAFKFSVRNVRSNSDFANRGICIVSEDGTTKLEFKTKSESSETVGFYLNDNILVADVQVQGVSKFKFNGTETGKRSNCFAIQVIPSKNEVCLIARDTEVVYSAKISSPINWNQKFYSKFYMSKASGAISMNIAQIETLLSTSY